MKQLYMIDNILSKIKGNTKRILIICFIGAVVTSCANIASPSGGAYDFDPPVVLRSNPHPNEMNVKGRKIEIVFDELVTVEKPMDKVIITPPQRNFPIIRAQNNKVVVELRDTLKPNTTYTIDFTDAIVDNNEKNALENFSLTFSTGDVVDSLAISGKVLAAENLEPVSGIYVGIHSDLSDTAFTKLPFLRISRTNELGNYSIKGVAPGKYKVYALGDLNRDYKYDDSEEAIAFMDSIIIPTIEPSIRFDSIYNRKTLLFDSLKEISYTRLLPDDIILRSFTSPIKRQYLQKHERLSNDQLSIYFGAPTQMPEVELLGQLKDVSNWSVLEKSIGNDTLKYWLTEPALVDMDTIKLRVSYLVSDSLNLLQPKTDTLSFINRKKKHVDKKKKDDKEEPQQIFLTLKTNINPTFDVYRNIDLEFDYPVEDFVKEKLQLQYKSDSLYRDVDFKLVIDTLNPRKYQIPYKWEPKGQYRFAVDSSAFRSYSGLTNDKMQIDFKIKDLDQYGSLDLVIHSIPSNTSAFVELLDKSDNPVRQSEVHDGIATFLYLDPGTYYARIILDSNGNGKWDPGDFSKGLEPELVLYYDKSFDIKAFWDIEEDWDIFALPLDKQKPLEITKNKPKDDDKRKREMKQRNAR